MALSDVVKFFSDRWDVIRPMFGSFLLAFAAAVLVGLTIGSWYYSGRIATAQAQIAQKDGEIARYRVALGIDKASQGAMVE